MLAIGLLPALRGTPRLLEHLTTVLGLSCYAGTTSSLLSASGSFCQIRLNLLQLGSMLTVRCGLHRWVVRVLMWWSVSSYHTTYTIDTTALIRTLSFLAKTGAWIAKLPIRDSHSISPDQVVSMSYIPYNISILEDCCHSACIQKCLVYWLS